MLLVTVLPLKKQEEMSWEEPSIDGIERWY
jgi:hypothetical protein